MKELVSGALVAMYFVAALFFLRFWRKTSDALFSYFSIAFAILAVQRLLIAAIGEDSEYNPWFYLLRLLAFLVILTGIWQKNRESSHGTKE